MRAADARRGTTMRTTSGMAGPFAWGDDTDRATGLDGLRRLDRRRVTQCALSRICGVCAEPLGRPVVFVGDRDEDARNAFHAPPLHEDCAHALLAYPGADPGWRLVRTAAFELVRPAREDSDRRPRFVPSARLGTPGHARDA